MSRSDDEIAQLRRDVDRLWMALEVIPAVADAVRFARTRQTTEIFELQNEWAARYGECIPVHVAAKIIGKTDETIRRWSREKKITKSETGGILTRSLAAYIELGLPSRQREKSNARRKRRA